MGCAYRETAHRLHVRGVSISVDHKYKGLLTLSDCETVSVEIPLYTALYCEWDDTNFGFIGLLVDAGADVNLKDGNDPTQRNSNGCRKERLHIVRVYSD